jgi:hypothetical protein
VAPREKYLASQTTIDAEQATVYLPAAFSPEAFLTGAAVAEESAGRRVATGDAVLVVRRLTVRARRLTLVVRSEEDVQVTARGDVSFVTFQGSATLAERGLRSLLVRNDGYTPLR